MKATDDDRTLRVVGFERGERGSIVDGSQTSIRRHSKATPMHRFIKHSAPVVGALLLGPGLISTSWGQISEPRFIVPPEQRNGDATQRGERDAPPSPAQSQDSSQSPQADQQPRQTQAQTQQRQRAVLDVQLKAGDDRGVIVSAVRPEGAAAKSGIRNNDIILEIDGQKIAEPRQVLIVLGRHQPGDQVSVTVLREGKEEPVEVTLGGAAAIETETQRRDARRPSTLGQTPGEQAADQGPLDQDGGTRIGEQPAGEREQSFRFEGGWLGVAVQPGGEDLKGLRVSRVFPGGPAARAGIRKDDILLDVEGQLLSEHGDLAKALEGTQAGDEVAVRITRGPDPKLNEQTKVVRLGESPRRNQTRLGDIEGTGEPNPTDRADQPVSRWEDSQGFATEIPPDAYELEYRRRMAEQNERLERLLINLNQEIQQLRQEVAALRGDGGAETVPLNEPPPAPTDDAAPPADSLESTPPVEGQQ